MKRNFNSVNDIVASNLCLHCGSCVVACPEALITQTLDDHGDWIPMIDTTCTNCRSCIAVCPGIKMDLRCKEAKNETSHELGHLRGAYIVRALAPILKNRRVASGGFASAIARTFFDDFHGGLVQWTSISKRTEFRPQARLLDFNAFQEVEGDSIYIPSFANIAFREIPADDRPILAIGLPCQIQGLSLLRKVRPRLSQQIYCTISLFCGLTIASDGIAFLIKESGHDMSEVAELRFRNSMGMMAKLNEETRLYLNKNRVSWSHMCSRCALCSDHTGELADISCGDAQLPYFMSKSRLSWSMVAIRSSVGMSLLRRAVQRGYLWAMRTTPADVVKAQKLMIFFKKECIKQRLLLNRLLGGINPHFLDFKITRSLSPTVLIGNLLLLIHLRLRRFKTYMKIITHSIMLNNFNKVIFQCLYLDIWRRLGRVSIRGLLRRFSSIGFIVKCVVTSARAKRLIRSIISNTNRLAITSNFSDDTLDRWKRQFPRAEKELLFAAKQLKDGKVKIFNRVYDLGKHGWNSSPVTHESYPKLQAFLMINHFDLFDKYGDVKDALELQKHYGLVELALAYRLTHDMGYLSALHHYIKSWCSEFYPNMGIGWCGNIDVAQRIVAWMFIYMLIFDGSPSEGVTICSEISRGLREHISVLKRRYQHPSNNQKAGSLCALIMYEMATSNGSVTKQLQKYLQELTTTVRELVSPYGAPQEGSLAYGRLVLEFLLLVKIISDSLSYILPQPLVSRTANMVDWFGRILGPEDLFPQFGDDSGERAFPFNNCLSDGRDCLLVGQELFSKPLKSELTPVASLLLGYAGSYTADRVRTCSKSSSFVDTETGYGRVSRINGLVRWTVWMRAGIFGLPPNFGHSHSDFLSMIVNYCGQQVLTEAGTFRYNTQTEDRLSDVLTEGHSGIRYEMLEQSNWCGTFEWSETSLFARLVETKDGLVGVITMPDGSILKRRIAVDDDHVDIDDEFETSNNEERLIEWTFIVDGSMQNELPCKKNVIVFPLREENRCLHLMRLGGWDGTCDLLPARIATEYGTSHEGCRLVVRSLVYGGASWSTRLWVV